MLIGQLLNTSENNGGVRSRMVKNTIRQLFWQGISQDSYPIKYIQLDSECIHYNKNLLISNPSRIFSCSCETSLKILIIVVWNTNNIHLMKGHLVQFKVLKPCHSLNFVAWWYSTKSVIYTRVVSFLREEIVWVTQICFKYWIIWPSFLDI